MCFGVVQWSCYSSSHACVLCLFFFFLFFLLLLLLFFFFNDTATTEIYTLSLHDALPISLFKMPISRCGSALLFKMPISRCGSPRFLYFPFLVVAAPSLLIMPISRCGRSEEHTSELQSHVRISYAVFCLKKKKKNNTQLLQLETKCSTVQTEDQGGDEARSH